MSHCDDGDPDEAVFWADLHEDLKDPEYARLHARAARRLKWRAFWWGFWHPFADQRALMKRRSPRGFLAESDENAPRP